MGLFGPSAMGLPTYRRNTGLKILFSIVSSIFAAYLLNFPFSFFKVPESILKFENWIFFASGILVLVGMVNYLRASKRYM